MPMKSNGATLGRRCARSRKSSCRSRCEEMACATSSKAWYRSARVSQGDADCRSIENQYAILIIPVQDLPTVHLIGDNPLVDSPPSRVIPPPKLYGFLVSSAVP